MSSPQAMGWAEPVRLTHPTGPCVRHPCLRRNPCGRPSPWGRQRARARRNPWGRHNPRGRHRSWGSSKPTRSPQCVGSARRTGWGRQSPWGCWRPWDRRGAEVAGTHGVARAHGAGANEVAGARGTAGAHAVAGAHVAASAARGCAGALGPPDGRSAWGRRSVWDSRHPYGRNPWGRRRPGSTQRKRSPSPATASQRAVGSTADGPTPLWPRARAGPACNRAATARALTASASSASWGLTSTAISWKTRCTTAAKAAPVKRLPPRCNMAPLEAANAANDSVVGKRKLASRAPRPPRPPSPPRTTTSAPTCKDGSPPRIRRRWRQPPEAMRPLRSAPRARLERGPPAGSGNSPSVHRKRHTPCGGATPGTLLRGAGAGEAKGHYVLGSTSCNNARSAQNPPHRSLDADGRPVAGRRRMLCRRPTAQAALNDAERIGARPEKGPAMAWFRLRHHYRRIINTATANTQHLPRNSTPPMTCLTGGSDQGWPSKSAEGKELMSCWSVDAYTTLLNKRSGMR